MYKRQSQTISLSENKSENSGKTERFKGEKV